jgi:hypothetical protein
MRLFKPALAYFAFIFGIGFVLGTIRVLWVIPLVGSRIAELVEMPLMLVAIILAARWVNQHFTNADTPSKRLSVGLIALSLLLIAEIGVGVELRGLSPTEALLNRDPVSGTIYYIMLGVFVLMPWLVARI